MNTSNYSLIIVESFYHYDGTVHVRPLPGQSPYESTMFVECSSTLKECYPVGTKFKIKAKITNREGGTPFIYSHYSWEYTKIED